LASKLPDETLRSRAGGTRFVKPHSFPPPAFADYELLDSGAGEKLERFGAHVLRRPDPQALWRPRRSSAEWERADLSFERESDRGGKWVPREGGSRRAREWNVEYAGSRFVVRPTPFKHVGIFPEQAPNWELLPRLRRAIGAEEPRMLNLFAYTGVASVLARQAGFHVTHVDASKASLEWTRANLEASGLASDSLRLVLDDALAFARRESRRGARYHVLLLDPPHYGRGPKGEKWQLETSLPEIVHALEPMLEERSLVILSTYAVGFTSLSLANLLEELGDNAIEHGELVLAETDGGQGRGKQRLLPAGFCARAWRGLEPLTDA
jgi:23S rRNA (cytosine1962-C5)-methyltransferase